MAKRPLNLTLSSGTNDHPPRWIAARPGAFVVLLAIAWAAVRLAVAPAHASEVLPFKPWPYGTPEAEWEALPGGVPASKAELAELQKDLFGAYLDLEKDGIPELITSEQGAVYCGSAGCPAAIYKMVNGAWKLFAQFHTADRLYYSDELIGEKRALFGPDRILIWNGRKYFDVCQTDQCRMETGQPPR